MAVITVDNISEENARDSSHVSNKLSCVLQLGNACTYLLHTY